MVTLWSEKVLDHFERPRNAGRLAEADWTGKVENPVCGDELEISVRRGEVIEAVGFAARGCVASMACGSALTELLLGKRKGELGAIRAAEVEAAVGGLGSASKHAAVLAADVVRKLEREWK
ncbi:MAG: iron-sulfur cluster assembly scaffold protein [Bryobacter sp.]|nr:iron-sulfur cluster assembly scaffold protein [Bryobacter sp.]